MALTFCLWLSYSRRNSWLSSALARARSMAWMSSSFSGPTFTGAKKLKNASSYAAISSNSRTDVPTTMTKLSVLRSFLKARCPVSFLAPLGKTWSKLSTSRRIRLPCDAEMRLSPSRIMAKLRLSSGSASALAKTAAASATSSSAARYSNASARRSRRVYAKNSSSRYCTTSQRCERSGAALILRRSIRRSVVLPMPLGPSSR